MENNFDGDLDKIQKKGFAFTVENEMEKELWAEIGRSVIRREFRERRIKSDRDKVLNRQDESEEREEKKSGPKSKTVKSNVRIYQIDGKYYDLFNLRKPQL